MVTMLDIDAVGAQVVALIDASAEGIDETALRARARELGVAVGAGAVSRSYCHPYAVVGWHTEPIGVDVERVVTCPEEFGPSISTPVEEAAAQWTTDRDVVSLWSSKEALAKALGDALHYDPRRLSRRPVASGRLRLVAHRRSYRCLTATAAGFAGERRSE